MTTVQVLGIRGPGMGKRFDVDEADLAAAVAEDGWAIEQVPDTVIFYDPTAPLNPEWKVPGYFIPPVLAIPGTDPNPPDPGAPIDQRTTRRN